MTNAFLPLSVHYPNESQYKEAFELCTQGKYESIFFDPKDIENDYCFVILETEKDFRVLYTRYDTCLDRFYNSENDTLHVFESRSVAFRYLAKRTRTWDHTNKINV
jgi:hypothetical protein